MTALEAVVEELKTLPNNKIEAVARYIRTLHSKNVGRFDDLAGCMAPEEVAKMAKAIEENCERVDGGDW